MRALHFLLPLLAGAFIATGSSATNVILWNTLGSVSEIGASQVGPDGTYVGGGFLVGPAPAFGGAYFNEAATDDPEVFFPREVISNPAGTVEFWGRLVGLPDSLPSAGDNPGFLFMGPDSNNIFRLAFNANDGRSGGGLCGGFRTPNGGTQTTACTGGFGSADYSDILGTSAVEDWHHYALVWDNEGIAGVDNGQRRLALFLDGELNTGFFRDDDSNIDFQDFTAGVLGLVSRGNSMLQLGAVAMDNLIAYDGAITNFDHRFTPEPLRMPEPSIMLLLAGGAGVLLMGRRAS